MTSRLPRSETVDLTSSPEPSNNECEMESQRRNRRMNQVDVSGVNRRISLVDLTNESRLSVSRDSISGEIEAALFRFTCPICFNIWPADHVSATICGHVYCTECIDAVFKEHKKCPTCNKALRKIDIFKLFI